MWNGDTQYHRKLRFAQTGIENTAAYEELIRVIEARGHTIEGMIVDSTDYLITYPLAYPTRIELPMKMNVPVITEVEFHGLLGRSTQ